MKLSKILLSTMLVSAIGVQAQKAPTIKNTKDTTTVKCHKPKKDKNPPDSLSSNQDSIRIKHYWKCEACGRG